MRFRVFVITALVAVVACGSAACAGRDGGAASSGLASSGPAASGPVVSQPVVSSAAAPPVSESKYRVTARKHADDAQLCDLFSAAELASILDSTPRTKPSGPFCTVTAKTSRGDRVIVVTVDSARLDDYEGHTATKRIAVGGNSAEQYPGEDGGCVVQTVLNDDAAALTQTMVVTLDPISGDANACSLARRVSSLVFHKLR